MIFYFPLNFLAQPLSQVMDSFIPQSSSSFTPPNHHPHLSLLHSIHPSTHLVSPVHPYNFTHPFTSPATSPSSVHLLSHPSTFPSTHPISCSPIHAVFYSPSIILFTGPPRSISASNTLQGANQLPFILHHLSLLYVHLSDSSWVPACARPQVLSSTCSVK